MVGIDWSSTDEFQLGLPLYVDSTIELVFVVERINPATNDTTVVFRRGALQPKDFPYTVKNLPAGYYRGWVNAILPYGPVTLNVGEFPLGTSCKLCTVFVL